MIGLVLRDVSGMVVAGVLIGTGAALALSGLARSMLFGLTPTDSMVMSPGARSASSPGSGCASASWKGGVGSASLAGND
jgi:hypothetical protein